MTIVSYKTADLSHELLHVIFPLENKCPQIMEWDVALHILGKAMIFHINLRNKEIISKQGQSRSKGEIQAVGM